MAHKKPSPTPPPAGQPARPQHGREPGRPPSFAGNPRLQADNRWQRTKRYGWNGR